MKVDGVKPDASETSRVVATVRSHGPGAPASVASTFAVTTVAMTALVAEVRLPEDELAPDGNQYSAVPSSDICTVNVHGFIALPQVSLTSVPVTL